MSKFWFLENVDVFKVLCPHKTRRHRKKHSSYKYGKQDFIYTQEDVANKVYLIEKGKVKIGYFTKDGTEVVKAILTKGELFGEKAILEEESRSEFAKSMDTQTTLCTVGAGQMQELMRNDETFSLKVYKFLGLRFKKLERRLDILLFKDVPTRVKEFLNELADDYGYCCPDTGDTIIKHPYTQKDIASLIGTSRPTFNTIMNDLKALNTLDFSRNEIRLKDSSD